MRWLGRSALVVAMLAAAAAIDVPARAQWFGNGFPFGSGNNPPAARQQSPQRNYNSFPSFGNQEQFIRPPQPVESTKPPPPRKFETPPASTIVVIGDSMADWLAYGLEELFADSTELGVVRKIRPTSGLVRYEPRNESLEWSQAIKDILATDKPSAIVVMLGLNDRLPLRERTSSRAPAQRNDEQQAAQAAQPAQPGQPAQSATPAAPSPAEAAPQEAAQPVVAAPERAEEGESFDFRSDKWADLYAKRIDDMIAALKGKGVPVLWVGLPAIRGPKSTGDMSYLDELYRERAEKAGIVYVDIWDGFVDESGRYATDGPDYEGQIRRLRTGDGVHFTKAGALKLASYVEQQLRRVLSSRLAPVALPVPMVSAPAKPGQRSAIGPAVPLTVSTGDDATDLLGAGIRPSPLASDPIAAQVLSRGDPLNAPVGRADNFSWPPPGVQANIAPDAKPEPATPRPRAAGPGDVKNKSGAAPDAEGIRSRHSPHARLDGAPSPPLPVAPAAASTR
jgi:uncharacterized protein